MNKQVMHEIAMATEQGEMTFPQAVRKSLEIGVESYLVDFAAERKTHYLADGTVHAIPMFLGHGPIAAEFDETALVKAIRAAQADTIRYPEFVKQAVSAGVIGYWAFLTGKRVIYLGRGGQQHIEEFPKPQA